MEEWVSSEGIGEIVGWMEGSRCELLSIGGALRQSDSKL